ncbi:potassium channel family protein [Thermococcus camini]|uniref:potassium channel family protein n=1 Tax=Thermococcus camini TaxID=2016373 RepID=UPI001660BA29|nr:potassium channel family protein [Thermococcus camini]
MNFKEAIFKGDVLFINSTFKKDVIFAYAKFRGDVFFSYSHFEGDVYFDKAHFEKRYSFFEAKFKNVSFCMAEFDGRGQGMKGPVIFGFNRCEFSGESDFYKVKFRDNVSFEGAVFKKYTLFFGATFEKDANFKHVKFDFTSGSEWIIPKYQNEDVERIFLGLRDIRKDIQNDNHGPPFIHPHEVEYEMTLGGDIEKTFRKAVFKGQTKFSYSTFRGFADFKNARFENDVEFIQVTFESETDFLNVVFEGKTVFNYSTFKKRTYFAWFPEWSSTPENASFKKYCSFEGARFSDEVSFTNVEFRGGINFYNAHFGKRVAFTKAKLHGDSTINYVNSEFLGSAQFDQAEFYNPAFFEHSVFKDTATFDFASFKEKVTFNFATFEKGASFKNAEFHGNVHFEDVEFKKTVEFQSAKFEGDAIFNGSTFEKRLIFVEKDTSKEPKPKFHGKLELSNCDFRQGVSFVILPASNTENAVREIESQLEELFDSSSPSYAYALQEAARVQRLSFENEGKREEADQMFVAEMRARRKIRMIDAIDALSSGKKWPVFRAMLYNFLEWLMGDLFSNYGTGWARLLYTGLGIPLLLFPIVYIFSQYSAFGINLGFILTLAVISSLIGAFTSQFFDIELKTKAKVKLAIHSTGIFGILWTIFALGTTLNPKGSICISTADSVCTPIGMSGIEGIFNVLYYSMVTFTTLGYGDMHPTGWLKALSAIEALTGAVFMALIVAVIARKWMR